jgi:hypothetical protein
VTRWLWSVATGHWGIDPKLPRKLEDVLDYFLPEAGVPASVKRANAHSDAELQPTRPSHPEWSPSANPIPRTRADRPAALPIIALPIGDRDVVHAAFAWNLVVEFARFGASATLLAPADRAAASLWPPSGRGPIGAELELVCATNLRELNRAALDVAVSRAAEAKNGGVVLTRVPPAWLNGLSDGRALLRWVLLFAATESNDLRETYGLAKRVLRASPSSRVGITIHGARRIEEAERAFSRFSDTTRRHLGHSVVSYGLLMDDLLIYRAIVAHRSIGLEHPQSRAARALRDVARLLFEDSQDHALG